MTTIQVNPTATQLPSVADFDDAIRNACVALKSGSIDAAITSLEKASRRAGEVGDPRATELANFANALGPGLETIQLVAMCLGDLSHDSEPTPTVASGRAAVDFRGGKPSGRSRRRYGRRRLFHKHQATR
jgi:hypothetical protein